MLNINLKAEIKDVRVHDFRNSCASLLIDSGANITLVAKYLGHSKIDETLNTYSHMYQNRLENIVQIIEVQNTKQLLIMKILIIMIMMKI